MIVGLSIAVLLLIMTGRIMYLSYQDLKQNRQE